MANKKIISMILAGTLVYGPAVTLKNYISKNALSDDLIKVTGKVNLNEDTNINSIECFDSSLYQQLNDTIYDYNQEQERIRYEYQMEQERLAYEQWLQENPQFPTYDLSDYELEGIARLCQQEQGTIEGAAAEASLMANRYELYGQNFASLYSYIRNSGWFYNSDVFMDDLSSLKPEIKEIVKKVLVDGLRTLPQYIDNHDCTSDIISGDDIIVKNIYGATYNYYYVPGCPDIFGYSDYAKSLYGDEHYEYQRVLER